MKYIIAAGTHMDEVHLADGTVSINQGGCGMYAMAGLRVFTKDVFPISGVEDDFLERYGAWYAKNVIPTTGLAQRLDFHGKTVITYFQDGSRVDAPTVGLVKNRTRNATIAEVERFCGTDTAGVYTFHNFAPLYIEGLIRLRGERGFKLLWEIAADGAQPEYLAGIEQYCRNVDIFSINMEEAKTLMSTEDEGAVLDAFRRRFGCWVFLREGSKGAYMITPEGCVHCPSVPNTPVVDPTGGGNSSSGAVLYAYCQGDPPLLAGIKGSVAAARIIAQFGPPAFYPEGSIQQAEQEALTLYQRCLHGEFDKA